MSLERFSHCLNRITTREQLLRIICVMAQKQSHMSDSTKHSIIIITIILELCLQYFGMLWRILGSDRQDRYRK